MKKFTALLVLLLCSSLQAQEHVILDFESPVDASIFAGKPNGTALNYVAPKTDSGSDVLTLAPGEGRNGSTALVVESPNSAAGIPGFWVMRSAALNGKPGTVYDESGYFLPRGMRANRLEFWVRFQAGFRASHAAKNASGSMHIGTYHVDPAKIGVNSQRMDETDNWHFYHHLLLRTDVAKDGWIRVVINDIPQHQRGQSQYRVQQNPTGLSGNYFELLTRFYIDSHPYFSAAEIPYPVKMWVDDIKLSYVPEKPPVGIQIENWDPDQEVDIPAGTQTNLKVAITNFGSVDLPGRLGIRSSYHYKPNILDGDASVSEQVMTLAPGQTRKLTMRLEPRADLALGRNGFHSLTFIPQSEERASSQSQADPNVQIDKFYWSTPAASMTPDANVVSTAIRTIIGPTANLRPTIRGGISFSTTTDKPITGQLTGHDPEGSPLKYVLTFQSPTGGKITLNEATGEFQFVPAAGFSGIFRFRYKVNDGIEDSREVASLVVVTACN